MGELFKEAVAYLIIKIVTVLKKVSILVVLSVAVLLLVHYLNGHLQSPKLNTFLSGIYDDFYLTIDIIISTPSMYALCYTVLEYCFRYFETRVLCKTS